MLHSALFILLTNRFLAILGELASHCEGRIPALFFMILEELCAGELIAELSKTKTAPGLLCSISLLGTSPKLNAIDLTSVAGINSLIETLQHRFVFTEVVMNLSTFLRDFREKLSQGRVRFNRRPNDGREAHDRAFLVFTKRRVAFKVLRPVDDGFQLRVGYRGRLV